MITKKCYDVQEQGTVITAYGPMPVACTKAVSGLDLMIVFPAGKKRHFRLHIVPVTRVSVWMAR
jgi:hypothetical protein